MIFRVAVLAAATLLLESTLLRFLSVAQFYHFAFLVVSLALLGLGISGSVLSIFPDLKEIPTRRLLSISGIGFSLSVLLGYFIVNFLPFDSYSIAWDIQQVGYLAIYLIALTMPFFFSGIAVGGAISANPGRSHIVYGWNLFGSAFGVLLALFAMQAAGVPGAFLLSSLLGLSILIPYWRWKTIGALLLGGLMVFVWISLSNSANLSPIGITLSPYKGLSQANLYPGSRSVYERWSAVSRIDVLADAGVRRFPGLSYTFQGVLPDQLGLTIDADNLQPITFEQPGVLDSINYLPESLAFKLASGGESLILGPGAGLSVLQAIAGNSGHIVTVSSDPSIDRAIEQTAGGLDPFKRPEVENLVETPRGFLARTSDRFNVIFLPLTDGYRPVVSGAYSLSEEYLLTVEAFRGMFRALDDRGLVVATRWLQTPPSEEVKMVATIAQALEMEGIAPSNSIVVYRSLQTVTVLARPEGWEPELLETVRAFVKDRKYDLVWAPDIQAAEVNLHNRLPEPSVYLAVRGLLSAEDFDQFIAEYPFAVDPPTDNHPFFFHFFDWEQAAEVMAAFGRVWQPFGGSGYFVLLLFLGIMLVLSALLILLPIVVGPGRAVLHSGGISKLPPFIYFSLLGLAFLFVEISLIQQTILLVGQPVYAFTLVVGVILVTSGLGSLFSRTSRVAPLAVLLALFLLTLLLSLGYARFLQVAIGWAFLLRLLTSALILAVLGFLMGMPYPIGLAWLESVRPAWVPWAWAINGCISVISAILAALIALDRGFTTVLLIGSLAYGGALLFYYWMSRAFSSNSHRMPG